MTVNSKNFQHAAPIIIFFKRVVHKGVH